MIDKSFCSKTNKLSSEYSEQWFINLQAHTHEYVKRNYPYYFNKKLFPIKAIRPGKLEKEPKFVLNHHTSGTRTMPAFARFCSSKMASCNFLTERDGNIIMFGSVRDMTFHAVLRTTSIANSIVIKRLFNIESGWVNEHGIETVGNGNKFLFNSEQFVSNICLQRNLVSLFPSIKELKSHRFFSPIERSGDPGPLYFLPLMQHAVFNDVDLDDSDYWLCYYKKDPIKFANNAGSIIKEYKLEDIDEWRSKRNLKYSDYNVLK